MKAPGRALPRYQTSGQFSGVLSQRAAAGLGLRRPYSAALGRQHWEMPTGHGDSVSFSHDGSTLVMDSGTLGVRQTLQSGHTQWIGCGAESGMTSNAVACASEYASQGVVAAVHHPCLLRPTEAGNEAISASQEATRAIHWLPEPSTETKAHTNDETPESRSPHLFIQYTVCSHDLSLRRARSCGFVINRACPPMVAYGPMSVNVAYPRLQAAGAQIMVHSNYG